MTDIRRPSIIIISAILLLSIGIAQEDAAPSAPATPPELETTKSMQRETQKAIQMLERAHYNQEPLSEIDFEAFIQQFMTDLDYNHMYFLRSDYEAFKTRYAKTMRGWLRRGELFPAFEIFTRFRDNALNRIEWINKRLEGEFDLKQDRVFRPDRNKEDWPADAQAADALWETRLTYDIVNQVLPTLAKQEDAEAEGEEVEEEKTYEEIVTEAKEKVQRRYERWKDNLLEIDSLAVQETFISALAHQYDPHSNFMSADTLGDFEMSMKNSFVGIGALLYDDDGFCTILELLPGGPAEQSRELDAGDVIVGVGQGPEGTFTDVIDLNLKKIVKLIKGESGTTVRLKIRPNPESSDERIVALERGEIKLTANLASAELHSVPLDKETVSIGVIDLPSFYGGDGVDISNSTGDVEELIKKLEKIGIEGLVLDLRRNGGGLLNEAIDLTGLFIPEGPVVQIRDSLGDTRTRFDENTKVAYNGPLTVLVSRYSASASEIVAGALQNHNRAVVIGDKTTHGKGTVQALFKVSSRSLFAQITDEKTGAAKITIQKFYLPNGSSTQHLGVSSDIAMDSINHMLPIGESDLDNALPWDTISPVEWDMKMEEYPSITWTSNDLLEDLSSLSTIRQESLPEFDYTRDYIDWYEGVRNKETVSLNLDVRLAERSENKERRDNMDEELKSLATDSYEFSEIKLSITEEQDAIAEQFKKEIAEIRATEEEDSSDPDAGSLASHEATPDEAEAMEEEEEELPDFDIYLREALRVTRDWVALNTGRVDMETLQASMMLPATSEEITESPKL
ncbi:MAG: carboxy terminal-processing peptidase [Opitutales bacterium]